MEKKDLVIVESKRVKQPDEFKFNYTFEVLDATAAAGRKIALDLDRRLEYDLISKNIHVSIRRNSGSGEGTIDVFVYHDYRNLGENGKLVCENELPIDSVGIESTMKHIANMLNKFETMNFEEFKTLYVK